MLAENLDRWVQETKAEGRAEGIAEGRAEGLAEGRALGRAEGWAEGVIEGTRRNLLLFLETKLGSVPAWLRRLLQESADADVLEKALQTAYRRFFSVPDMLTSLVRDYVHMDFVKDVDFSSLMVRSSAYVSDDMHTQAGDLVWQMKWKGRDAYLLLLLEAQNTPDKYMALRIFNYVGLLWKSLVDQGDEVQKEGLPHVFPVVLYNGSTRWTAARSITELLEQKSGRSTDDQPTCKYYLIDEGGACTGGHRCPPWPSYVLPRKRNVRRAAKRFRGLSRVYARGDVSLDVVRSCVASFVGYM